MLLTTAQTLFAHVILLSFNPEPQAGSGPEPSARDREAAAAMAAGATAAAARQLRKDIPVQVLVWHSPTLQAASLQL